MLLKRRPHKRWWGIRFNALSVFETNFLTKNVELSLLASQYLTLYIYESFKLFPTCLKPCMNNLNRLGLFKTNNLCQAQLYPTRPAQYTLLLLKRQIETIKSMSRARGLMRARS